MTRALLWKEWREQRPIVIAGLATAIVLPFVLAAYVASTGREADLASLALLVPLVMWPLLAAACGASTVSGEIGEGTLGFLLSRPVSRMRVWLVKVAMAWFALSVVMAASVGVFAVFARAQGRRAIVDVVQPGLIPVIAGGLLLLFACSAFFSTFLSRSMTAAAAGLVIALAIGALIVLVWTRIGIQPQAEWDLLALELFAAAALVLLASLRIFTAGELLSGRRALREGLLAGTAALGLLVLLSVPVVLAKTRLDAASAQLFDVRLMPDRNALVATAHGPEGSSPQLWMVYLDGSGFERLTGRLAGWPAVSPDGKYVAYVSVRGAFGLRSDRSSLQVVRIDGSGASVLVPDVGEALPFHESYGWVHIAWSPDAQRIALRNGTTIVVATVDGSWQVNRPSGPSSELQRFGQLAGWSPDGKEIVLITPAWQRDEPTRIVAYDPQSNRTREIFTSPRHRISAPGGDRVIGSKLPLLLANGSAESPSGAGRSTLLEVNVLDGSVRTLFENPCPMGFGYSPDGDTLVYGACADRGTDVEVRFRDLSTGVERAAKSPSAEAWNLVPSPDAERVALQRSFDLAGPTMVLSLDGTVTEFAGTWTPVGWTGRSGVVLAEPGVSGYGRVAVGDAATGEVRVVFPSSSGS